MSTKPRRASARPKRKPSLYLAGPLGFSEAGREFHDGTIVPLLKKLGYRLLDPWALADAKAIARVTRMRYGAAKRDAWRRLNREIGTRNAAAIDACDAVFAVLDGADVDSGTAAEIGYAAARRKPILGYRGDLRLSADNEGALVNLQVEYFIRASGGTIVARLADVSRALAKLLR